MHETFHRKHLDLVVTATRRDRNMWNECTNFSKTHNVRLHKMVGNGNREV